jgi:hypothetical protein
MIWKDVCFGRPTEVTPLPAVRETQEEKLLSNAHEGDKSLYLSGLPKEEGTILLTVAEDRL